MSANDVLCHAAEPLFFLDCFSCSKLDVDVACQVISSISHGCQMAGCALIGLLMVFVAPTYWHQTTSLTEGVGRSCGWRRSLASWLFFLVGARVPFSALTLFVGWQEGHLAHKNPVQLIPWGSLPEKENWGALVIERQPLSYNNNNNPTYRAPECRKTSVVLAYRQGHAC